jgi:iron complex outermembrane recepter protein
VSAFTSDTLNVDRITTIADLNSIAPDVSINGRAQGAENPITIRGVGSDFLGLGADDAVAVYLDGVYQGRQYGAISELPGVDRIEVLRGPQGTLYGRNATGGAISIVSKEPSPDAAFSMNAGYGSRNERFVNGYGTAGILGDAAAVSLSGAYRQRDGYSHNLYTNTDLNDLENWDLNGAIRLLTVSNLRLILRGDVGVLRSSFQSKDITNGDGDPDRYNVNFPGREERRFGGIGLTAEYDFGPATLTSITATRRASYFGTFDSDGTALDLFRLDPYYEDQHQFSEELRIASNGQGRFQWLIGGYYYRERTSGTVDLGFIVFASSLSLVSANLTHSTAAFGEVSYRLTSKLKATAGLRSSQDLKAFDFHQVASGGLFPSVPFSHSINDAHALTPRYVLDYQFDPQVLGYASASRGFRSGGFSAINPLPFGTPLPFHPEYIWAYEIGLKSELFERRLRWNNAVFYYDYKDLQVRSSDQYGFVVIQNAASAHIKGVETELTARPSEHFEFGSSLSYLDARYTHYVSAVPGLSVVDESGHYLNRAPKWSTEEWVQPSARLGALGTLTLRASYWYKTTLWYSEDNLQPYGSGATGELKARLTYTPERGPWSVAIYGDNLTDRRWRTSVFDVVGHPQALFNPPRLVGVDIHVAL